MGLDFWFICSHWKTKQLLHHLKSERNLLEVAKELYICVEAARTRTHIRASALEHQIQRDSDRLCKMGQEINTDVSSRNLQKRFSSVCP
ncbi:hypothetical protein TNIN_388541 [Trichonephila inaurata madagascariensis]|uniref:Uncharacterized protein n=1 Tax=Trichonephila inaurata madagascariensis TaxID=2747483 RepID=A0A8X6I8R5_9ARAC|nr:hypothetical protein TNIN_388541 [Trichonephila inaurata madagascariensis]